MNLLEHTKASLALEDLIASAVDQYGEITDAQQAEILEQWAAEVDGGFDAKLEACGVLYRNLSAEADARRAEAKRQGDLAQSLENRADRLKRWVKYCMEVGGMEKAKAGLFAFAIQKNGGKLPLIGLDAIDPATLPKHLRIVEISTTANADAIREAIERGEVVEGVSIGERGTHLRIK